MFFCKLNFLGCTSLKMVQPLGLKILPCFFTYTNEKISTLPAVIRVYPSSCIRDLRVHYVIKLCTLIVVAAFTIYFSISESFYCLMIYNDGSKSVVIKYECYNILVKIEVCLFMVYNK